MKLFKWRKFMGLAITKSAGLLLLLLWSQLALAQAKTDGKKFHAGLKAGMNTSQITGDEATGFYKFSFVGGIFANSKIGDKWKFQYELIYQQKGSNKPALPDKGIHNSYKIRLNYIEVPLLLQYPLKRFEIEAGPGLGFLIGTKEWDQTGERPDGTSPYDWRVFELDGMIGANYYIQPDHFFANVRVHHSLTSIVSKKDQVVNDPRKGAWNIVIAATLNYQF